jgi:hypothetical protein
MPIRIRRFIAGAASLALVLYAFGMVEAQQPKLEMHRAGVSADDGSGWHTAVSTKGTFAVRLPIPFNDFTIHSTNTGGISHVIGGKSSEGIKFSAVESPVTPNTPVDLGEIPKSFASNPTNKVSELDRSSKDGVDTLSFSVTNSASTAHIRYIRTKSALYTLTIECPNAYREVAAAAKDQFFASFRLKGKP